MQEASEAAGISGRRGREWVGRASREEPLTRPELKAVLQSNDPRVGARAGNRAAERAAHDAADCTRCEDQCLERGADHVSQQFREHCTEVAVTHKRIRPYTPRINGKAERFIQTLLREWAYRFAYQNSAERQRWLAPYVHFHNYHRAHSALGYNPPISRLDRNNVLKRNS